MCQLKRANPWSRPALSCHRNGPVLLLLYGLRLALGRGTLGNRRLDLLARIDKALHGVHRTHELLLLGRVEVDLYDPLHTARTDHHRHADIHVLHAELAIEIGSARENALLVLQIGFGHLDAGGGRRIEGGTGLQQADDFRTTIARALDDRVKTLLRG